MQPCGVHSQQRVTKSSRGLYCWQPHIPSCNICTRHMKHMCMVQNLHFASHTAGHNPHITSLHSVFASCTSFGNPRRYAVGRQLVTSGFEQAPYARNCRFELVQHEATLGQNLPKSQKHPTPNVATCDALLRLRVLLASGRNALPHFHQCGRPSQSCNTRTRPSEKQ